MPLPDADLDLDPATAAALLRAADRDVSFAAASAMDAREFLAAVRYELTHPDTGYLVGVDIGDDDNGMQVFFRRPGRDRDPFRGHFAILERHHAIHAIPTPPELDGIDWEDLTAGGYPPPTTMYPFTDDLNRAAARAYGDSE